MKDLWKNLAFSWNYAKSEKLKIFGFIICNIIYIVISIILPIISAKIIINLTSNHLDQVLLMSVVLFVIEIIHNIINFLINYFSQVVYRETFKKIQMNLGKSILKLKNSCLDSYSSGVFIQRFSYDTSKIADIFNVINFHLSTILKDVGIFGAVLIIDARVFAYLLFMMIIIGILEKKRVSYRNEKDKIFREENENVSGFVGELVRGVRDIKMLHAEKSFLSEMESRLNTLNMKRYEMGKVNRNYQFFIGDLRDFLNLSMICLLVYLISINQMEIAMALVVYNYMNNASYLVNHYSYLMEGIKDFNLSTNRVFDIIHGEKFLKEEFGNKHLDTIKGNFEFKDVSFEYEDNLPVLKNLSFKVKAKTTIAFVGKSGAGKTTIFNLLCKMYEPTSGTIYIDGEDISKLDCSSIRSNISIISQNPYIFNVSIRDNLRLIKDDLTEEEMMDACKKACLDEFINNLPNQYDTIVGEGGISLSGGQRQRLAIARAFLQKTEIILFDEATSALDNETQHRIQQAIENLQKKYTVLIIAHRLSTIKHANRILFLEDGNIKAEGTHDELLANCSEYRNLYESEIEK